MTQPYWSYTVSVSWRLFAGAMVKADGLITIRDGTGHADRTVTVAVPVSLIPSTDAVIVVVPPQTAVKRPVSSMVPTDSSQLVQITGASDVMLPSRSNAVAVNCQVLSTSRVISDGETATASIRPEGASMTVMVAVPVTPSADAVMVAVPSSRAVKRPLQGSCRHMIPCRPR